MDENLGTYMPGQARAWLPMFAPARRRQLRHSSATSQVCCILKAYSSMRPHVAGARRFLSASRAGRQFRARVETLR